MKKRQINSKFGNALTALRGHLAKCHLCRAVMKGGGVDSMCVEGVALTHDMALAATKLVALHRKAYDNPQGYVYPCPDRTVHGRDWASTSEPHVDVATQPALF